MPKAGFYAVKKGQNPGIYSTWEECREQTEGFKKAEYKKFNTRQQAEAWLRITSNAATSAGAGNPTSVASSSKSSSLGPAITTVPGPYDKSARPSYAGSSVAPDQTQWVPVYTDGACKGNGQKGSVAGIGVWYGVNDPRNLSERCPGDQTNNRAELIAIIRCLEMDLDPSQPLVIKTDSRYSIDCMEKWLKNWRAKGWKTIDGKNVKNKEVIMHLAHLVGQRRGRVNFEYVKGHSGIPGNEGADRLAVHGTTKPVQPERSWVLEEDEESQSPDPPPTFGDNVKVDPDVRRNGLAPGSTALETDFQVGDEDVLSTEELDRMEREQNFD